MRPFGAVMALVAATSSAADWPQWLGPTRDGSSPEVVKAWKEPPKILWRQPAGEGHSSPVVAGDRVFFHAKSKDKDAEEVTALDAATGKLLWQSSYPRTGFTSIFGNGPRATPAVVDGKLYTLGVTGVLTCWEAATGKQVWQTDTLKTFHAANLFFGVSCSPVIDGDRVLVNVGGAGASIVAFDKNNGEVLWKTLDDKASYASPIVVENGQRQAVFFTHEGLVSLNPQTGRLFWRFPLVDLLSESSATPMRAGDILVASAITKGSVGLRLQQADGQPTAAEVWKNPDLTCYFSTPVAVGDEHIYLVTGTKPPALRTQADLHCIVAKTGKVLWTKPKVGKYHATLLRTGNDKLLMLEEAGDLVLIEPDPKEYREIARARVCGETWAHPALANGRLFVRDAKEIICVQLAP
jgi:outer membrane protein assembly factor BamB